MKYDHAIRLQKLHNAGRYIDLMDRLNGWVPEVLEMPITNLPDDMHPAHWGDRFKEGCQIEDMGLTVQEAEVIVLLDELMSEGGAQ